MRLLHFVL